MDQTSNVAHTRNALAGGLADDRAVAADGVDRCAPWSGLLASAGPRDHIVQLYQDQDFLNRAVCRFAAAAIANGEGIILVPTAAHWQAFRPRLETEGVDVDAAQACGQLTVVDADELLPQFMRDSMPDAPVFLGLASDVIATARAGGRYPKVRWWGEMVNVLWERGDVAASMHLEDQFDHLAHEHEIAIFCSFAMDNFNGEVHSRMLPRLGENHSHLIPVEDYVRLERAVADALRETVGRERGHRPRRAAAFPLLGAGPDAPIPGAAPGVAREPPGRRGVGSGAKPQALQRLAGLNAVTNRQSPGDIPPHEARGAKGEAAGANPLSADVDGILDTVDVPIMVVGLDATLILFNRAATDAFGLSPSDLGRSLSSGAAFADAKDLETLCAQVIADAAPIRRDVQSGDRRFLLRVAPYTRSTGEVAGAVLTFTNVTAFRASLDQAVTNVYTRRRSSTR